MRGGKEVGNETSIREEELKGKRDKHQGRSERREKKGGLASCVWCRTRKE